MKSIVIAVAALTVLSSAALASPPAASKAHSPAKATKKTAPLRCVVSGDKIASVAAAAGHATYKGKTYYFCCSDCKPRFDKNPAKFAANAAKGKYEKM